MVLFQSLRDSDRSNIPWNTNSKSFHPKVKCYQETDIKIFKCRSASPSPSSLHARARARAHTHTHTHTHNTWVVPFNSKKANFIKQIKKALKVSQFSQINH